MNIDKAVIVEIAKLQLEPGDVLVLKVDKILEDAQAVHLREMLRTLVPDSVNIAVLGFGMMFEIVRVVKGTA